MVNGVYHHYMRHSCAKGFLDLNFKEAVFDKISIFYEVSPNSHTHEVVILKV